MVASPPIGIILFIAAVIVAVYAAMRLSFGSLAIFDGAGPIEGLRRSWSISQGAVLRIFGWYLMASLISLGIALVSSIVSLPFAAGRFTFGAQLISSLGSGLATVLLAFMVAVLYESQRARKIPGLYPVDPRWLAAQGYGPGPGAMGSSSWLGEHPVRILPRRGGRLLLGDRLRWGPPPGAYPPGAYPPGSYPPGPPAGPAGYPPTAFPPGPYPPGPGAFPPGAPAPYPPAYPPSAYPPSAFPPASYPPGPAQENPPAGPEVGFPPTDASGSSGSGDAPQDPDTTPER